MPVFDIQPNGIHIRDAYVVVAHSFVRDEVGFLVLNWHDNLFYRVKGPVSTSGFVLSALRYEDVRVLTLGPRIDFAFKASFCFDYLSYILCVSRQWLKALQPGMRSLQRNSRILVINRNGVAYI